MDNFTGSFGSRTFNMADEYADDHEESRNWETGTDLPESQFVPQPPFNRNPVFPDEIPDSQEDPRNEVRNSAEDDLEYDLDDYHTTPTDDNDGFNGPEAGHNGQVFPTEIPDSQQDPADYLSDNGTGNDLDELSTEVPSDSPGNERQLQAFNFFNNALGVATLSGSSRVFRDEIPDTQEDFQDLSLEDNIDEVLTVRDSQEESNPGGEANTDEEDFNAEDTYHGHEIIAGEGNPVETTSVHTEATEITPGGTQPTHRIVSPAPSSLFITHIVKSYTTTSRLFDCGRGFILEPSL